MTTLASLKGQRFGVLTVLRDPESGGQMRRVWVRCACGMESSVVAYQLIHHGANRIRCSRDGCTDRQRAKAARSVAS